MPIAAIDQAVPEFGFLGARLSFPFYYAEMAYSFAQWRQIRNLYWVRGELLLAATSPDPNGAEPAFLQALEIARAQHHRIHGLRAATPLARLWSAQGKRAEPVALLAPLYDEFTEGFGTRDLREAKAMLDTLRG